MNEQERAEQHLSTIRRLMERATIYRAISAPTALVGGVLSLVASAICWKSPFLDMFNDSDDAEPVHGISPFIAVWLVVLLITVLANALFLVAGAKKRNEPVFSSSMKAAFAALAPAFMLGGLFTIIYIGSPADRGVNSVVSTGWITCYGLGLLATSYFAPSSLKYLGWAFLISGMVAICFFVFGGDFAQMLIAHHFSIFLMALTFGLYHLIYAACVWPRKGAAPEP